MIRCFNDYVRPRSDEVEGRFEGRAVGEAALQMDTRLVDLKIGQQGFQFGLIISMIETEGVWLRWLKVSFMADGFDGVTLRCGKEFA